MSRSIRLSLLALLFGFGVGCKSAPATNVCESDAECTAVGTRCDLPTNRCVCATDEACGPEEFCNRAGICQQQAGCTANEDCEALVGTFCDIESGKCLVGPALMLSAQCGLSSHCPYGTICSGDQCVAGCFGDGDCVLGDICLDGVCAGGEGVCAGDDFCDFRERCVRNECRSDRRGPYCRGCSFRTALNPEPCDDPKNFCLINSAENGGFPQFCGVDCSLGQTCPNGYDCNFVVILTEQTCFSNAQCQCDRNSIAFATETCDVNERCVPRNPDGTPDPNSDFCRVDRHPSCNPEGSGDAFCLVRTGTTAGFCTCDGDEDCEAGAVCVGGQCCTGEVNEDKQCAVGEGRVSGFCTCSTDSDCPRDSCDPSRGACAISGNPCTPGNNDCGAVPCVNGGCQIGQNCAPIQGLSCSDVGG